MKTALRGRFVFLRAYQKKKKKKQSPENCLAQPSSARLPPREDRNKYKDPLPDIMQRVRGLGMLSPNKVFLSNPSPQSSGKPKRACKSQRGLRAQENKALKINSL